MALIVDEQSNLKHFCRICKKGFGCGRALGGHMRAHGIGGDESSGGGGHLDDEDPVSDWEEKLGAGNVPPTNKRMYALRTNPNRFKSCRVCENCGKEFLSWKSFLEHGKCSSDDVESLVSDADDGRRGCSGHGWSKRKRSLRAKVGNFNSNCPSSEEEDLANVLMMLSNAAVDPLAAAEPEESCASASKDLEERRNQKNFINPISYKLAIDHKAKGVAGKGMFECKACKKVFNSHQALGGHRASHKKVKGCFAARLDHLEDQDNLAHEDFITQEEFFPTKPTSTLQFDQHFPIASTSNRKSKVHECSICHRIFSSGQALGGHKRCHWITSNSPDTASMKFHQFRDHQIEQIQQRPKYNIIDSEALDLNLDLNLPAAGDHDLAGAGWDRANPSSFEVSTEIQLQYDHHHHGSYHERKQNDNDNNVNNNDDKNIINGGGSKQNVEDEADSKVKLAKLSELKDMSMTEGSSPWLQVGIGSTTDVEADP